MALTDLIEQGLLATPDGELDPQAVLDRYSSSKGPLYAALARATPQATAQLQETRESLRSLTTKRKAEVGRAAADKSRAKKAERRASVAEKRLKQATDALAIQQDLIDRTKALRDTGLDDGSLTALTRIFGQAAKTAGITPEQAVSRFLKTATDFEGSATFDRQVADAAGREGRGRRAATGVQRQGA